MQSNQKVIQGLIQKIQSPLQQIRNRAITTLYTKVSAKIMTETDLSKAKQLPGVLFAWINENTPINKDCLYKVLSILHRYTMTETGMQLLFEYEAMEFLEEFRKFLMANQTNVDQQCDIIKKIIKTLLPLEGNRVEKNGDKENQEEKDEVEANNRLGASKLNQQQAGDSDNDDISTSSLKNGKNKPPNKNQPSKTNKKSNKQRHIISFYSLSDDLPKQIDQQLYSLLIQLKHGKKQSVLETLIKIEELINFWGHRYFKYKEELAREIVTVIEGKVYSEVGCRILAVLIRQLLEMEEDIGVDESVEANSYVRNYLKTTKISHKAIKPRFQKVQIELKFQIFSENPFTYTILQTFITKNKSSLISSSVIEYLLIAVQRYPFSASFIASLLQKINNNKLWLSEKLSANKFYQEQMFRMINHCCEVQNDIYLQIVPFLSKFFPEKSLEQISRKIPKLSAQLEQQEIQQSFDVLTSYSQTKGNSFQKEGFDFNLQLHQLQTHVKNLEKGVTGLPKKPEIISLYIDFLLMLAISVAKEDPLSSYYPKIKSLILKISQHEHLTCRMELFDFLLLTFNSSEKISYLAQSYPKSDIIRLAFSDADFYTELFANALNQEETIGSFLEITKLIQSTTKEQNRKYLNKFASIFYILSNHSPNQKNPNPIAINSSAKIILSRISKKYQVPCILLSLFSKQKEQRLKTYTTILSLNETDDLLKICIKQSNLPEKKHLKYSLSTIRNYINIIMNPKIENQVKASAIEEMIECCQRIDLWEIEKNNEELLKQILAIKSSVQTFIMSFLQHPQQQTEQLMFFIQLVRIYSILQKRLLLQVQTIGLNQVIKPLSSELYLNILINICGVVNQDTLSNQRFSKVIPEFMALVYLRTFGTFTSELFSRKEGKTKEFKRNVMNVHWFLGMFPHEELIKSEVMQVGSIPKRTEFVSKDNLSKENKEKEKAIQNFLKGYKLNVKSLKQLIDLYIQKISNQSPLNTQTFKLRKSILCPIVQRELSSSIHNITSSQNQISFLSLILETFSLPFNKPKQNILQPLQQIVPHLMNQFVKPNIAEHIKILLINISNFIGWKKTKNFDGIVQEINPNELYYLKLVDKLPKLGSDEMAKIIKIALANVQNINFYPSTCLLWKILLKPTNLKTLILSSTEYTQLSVINSLTKCIKHEIFDQRMINFSIILLHQLLNEVYFEVRKLPQSSLMSLDDFDQNKQGKKVVELTKLIVSREINSDLIDFILHQFDKDHSNQINKLTLQNLCFMLQALKISINLTNFSSEHSLFTQQNLNRQNKHIKLLLIQLNECIRSNPQIVSFPSMEMFFSSVFNFVNTFKKTESFCQTFNQVDLLDLALNLFAQKAKLLLRNQPIEKLNKNTSETFLLFCSILEYCFLKITSQPSEVSHYLLSSTNLIEASINLLIFLKTVQIQLQPTSKAINYIREVLEKLGKVLHTVSLHQEDYFIFKLNQLSQEQKNLNLLQIFGRLIDLGDENFMICFMRLALIWEGHTDSTKSGKKAQFEILNPLELFDEEEDDSSLEERELFQNNKAPKNSHHNIWIHTVIDIVVQRNQIRHCKSLLALSLPAKMFLVEKLAFFQYLKKVSNLIDSKIIYETTAGKKKPIKKSTVGNNSSVLLSNSRRTVLSQNQSCVQDQMKNFNEEEKLMEIEEFLKVLISLFAVSQELLNSEKIDHFVSNFTTHLNKHKDVLRKVFYIVDKLYTLSQILMSSLTPNKQFSEKFMKLINALSESVIFSQSLSNHLTQVTSPMLEESLSTILKGISQPLYQQDSQKMKQALKLLTILSNHESVRSYIYKNKLIEELNGKIMKYEDKKNDKTDFLNMNSLYDIVGFYLNLSHFKDSHQKILNDKKVLQVLVNQVYMQKSTLVSQKIIELLSNLSAYKLNKAIFMQNREIHKAILGQLESDQVQYKSHLLSLMYNLIYRHAPGVKLYKRKDVVEMLETIHWEKYENWDNVKHIFSGLMEVLTSDSEIPDKN